MSKPGVADWLELSRAAKYLVGAPRLIQVFEWQECPHKLHTFTDSDWAGDRETRRSTSGGAVTFGRHTLKTCATAQTALALSSGEAELYALVKGAAQSFGIMSMFADFGIAVNCTVCTDASAAIGIVHRQGLAKTTHLEGQYLWVQQVVSEGKLGVVKVGTDANPADLMTKHLRAEVANKHLEALRFYVATGRAASAPALSACSRNEGDDRWMRRDGAEVIERRHHKPRFALFTPIKIGRMPKTVVALGR